METQAWEVPVREFLNNHGIDLHFALYPWCESEVGSISHCFIGCYHISGVWRKNLLWWGITDLFPSSIEETLSLPERFLDRLARRSITVVIWTLFYFIWRRRNSLIFSGSRSLGCDLAFEIKLLSFF